MFFLAQTFVTRLTVAVSAHERTWDGASSDTGRRLFTAVDAVLARASTVKTVRTSIMNCFIALA